MPPHAMLPNQPAGANDFYYGSPSNEVERSQRASQDEEIARRYQLESDREFKLKVKELERKKEEIAIKKGQAAAEKWYRQESVKLAKEELQQKQQQFEMTFGEGQRQFNQTFGENQRQFDTTFGENQRQFNTTASGYLDGKPTLARDQFQDTSLRGWTQDAIALASKPKSWVDYKRMTTGVANNIGSIPGLAWTTGGQVGNTTFTGNPETNSLSNVMGSMGVGSGGGGGGGWALQAAQQANQIAATPLNLNSQEQQIYKTADEFARNPQGAAPGWYDSLDPMTKDLLEGAATAQGHDWATALARLKRASWGGGGLASAA